MTTGLKEKNVVLGVSGGIAAYKAVELLRLLVKAGAETRVVMTRNATRFVGPLTFEALSGRDVCVDLFDPHESAGIRHIQWAEAADAVIVAPATANIIGKLANGLADDALSTFMLAVTSPVMVCPAMNTNMYAAEAVQANLKALKQFGYTLLDPAAGELACGTVGPGRLPEPEYIFDRFLHLISPKDLAGRQVLVTAGPTRESIDPVRFISNPSSGKMGYAIARAAEMRGAAVTLISGPVEIAPPNHVNVIAVETAAQMHDAVVRHAGDAGIIIKSAAVADYAPAQAAPHKIKKTDGPETLVLERTQDILKSIAGNGKGRITVGFAAETRDLDRNATEKLRTKQLDMLVGNLVGVDGSGFQADTNQVTLYFKDGTRIPLDKMAKSDLAHLILDHVVQLAGR
ncbi:MAG: bifunctional phosphopantothenoylcysteine decarboxylase/phosphopantothenate--cysteine ligase CoaBC [Desulfobacteraceae bacterium]